MSRLLALLMPPLAPMSVRHVAVVRRPDDHRLRRVYAAMAEGPDARHPTVPGACLAPEVLAGLWLVARETWLASPASRVSREAVAVGISEANRCPFCIEVHSRALRVGGGTEEPSVAWSRATGRAVSTEPGARPFPAEPAGGSSSAPRSSSTT